MPKPRVPPNQRVVDSLPVLNLEDVPEFDPENWRLTVDGLVEEKLSLSFDEVLALPKTGIVSDFHCVTGWSKLDNAWEGVGFEEIIKLAGPLSKAKYVTVYAEGFYSSSLSLEELLKVGVLLAYALEGAPLKPEHGFPLRLVVPQKYAYKSVKWVRRLKFTAEKELGYWEKRGYSDGADPWREERYQKS